MSQSIARRIIADFILFVSVFLSPWFITAPLGLIFLLYFYRYYEAIFAALMLDALFGLATPHLLNTPYIFTLFFSALFLVGEFLKPRLRFYT